MGKTCSANETWHSFSCHPEKITFIAFLLKTVLLSFYCVTPCLHLPASVHTPIQSVCQQCLLVVGLLARRWGRRKEPCSQGSHGHNHVHEWTMTKQWSVLWPHVSTLECQPEESREASLGNEPTRIKSWLDKSYVTQGRVRVRLQLNTWCVVPEPVSQHTLDPTLSPSPFPFTTPHQYQLLSCGYTKTGLETEGE